MQIDFPFVRSSPICPLCGESKDAGAICCWFCYRERNLREGNEEAEALIAEADARMRLSSCTPTQ